MDTLAEQQLAVLYSDGELVPVRLRIGRPSPHPKGDFVCSVQADGLRLWQGPTEFAGVSSFQALVLGLRFLYHVLSFEVENGAVVHWEDGEHTLDVHELFALHKELAKKSGEE